MPLDPTKLLPASRQLADRLFAFAPDVEKYAAMEEDAPESGTFQLLVTIPSPTGDAHRAIVFWMVDDVPSLGFGEWHTHADPFGDRSDAGLDELLALFQAIRNDEALLCRGTATNGNRFETLLDLRDPDALDDELTAPGGPTELELLSWSGKACRCVGVR